MADEALPDDDARISVGMVSHPTIGARHQWSTGRVSFCWMVSRITGNRRMTLGALSTRIPGADPARDDPSGIPGFVFRVGKDPSFEPIHAFAICSSAVSALLRLEIAQVFKHENPSMVRLRKRHDAMTDQMRGLFIEAAHFGPQSHIVLLAFREDAGLASVACNLS